MDAMSKARLFIPLLVTGILCGGCGDAPPPVQSVSGTVPVAGFVTLDGQPLPRGRIVFIDTDRKPPEMFLASIEGGKFESEAPPGDLRVEIRSFELPDPGVAVDATGRFPQIIPAQYNEKSKLSAEVTAVGSNKFSFALESGGT